MKTKLILLFTYTIISVILISCDDPKTKTDIIISAPLPSWNDTQTKENIIAFVHSITDENSSDYVEVKDRIATFDNDGNLWAEQPYYYQLKFAIDQIKSMSVDHPEWKDDVTFNAAINDDIPGILQQGKEGLVKIMMTSHAGMSVEDFERSVASWINTAVHPTTGRHYNEMIYQPMLELLDYLRANEFKVFIVSGGGIEFMRVWAEDAYDVPKDQIIGSTIKTEYLVNDGDPVIMRLPELDFNDDKEGKPISINKFIGRKPIFASGNSDGDLRMMQYTASGDGKRFMLYLHHTDAEREWAYDRDSHIGKLDKGLDEAKKNGWTVIDMSKDWKVIYPFDR